jgi:hypothetical protein
MNTPSDPPPLREADLRQGFAALDELAQAEYHRSLGEILAEPIGEMYPVMQIGRLVGVVVKQPFSTPVELDPPSDITGAHRAWELLGGSDFHEPARTETWQFRLLQELAADGDAYDLAVQAHHERGFFAHLAGSTAHYICGDPAVRDEVERAVNEARNAGVNVSLTSPNVIMGSAGMSVGVLLVQSVPFLGFVGAPVIAGLILILYRIGVDAFCGWSRDLYAPLERS